MQTIPKTTSGCDRYLRRLIDRAKALQGEVSLILYLIDECRSYKAEREGEGNGGEE